MTAFTATIRHHSISRARFVDCGDNLAKAKTLADQEFGDEQHDYIITIFGQDEAHVPEIFSERRVATPQWQDRW